LSYSCKLVAIARVGWINFKAEAKPESHKQEAEQQRKIEIESFN